MAWSTEISTTTTLAKWIPSEWKAEIEPFAYPKSVALGFVVNWPAGEGGTTYVPKTAEITCSALPVNGSVVTLSYNTEDYATVTPTARGASIGIPKAVAAVLIRTAEGHYQMQLAEAIQKDKQTRILTQVASLTTHANIVGGDASHIEKDGLLDAIAHVVDSDARGDMVGIFSTKEYGRFFKISDFVDASKVGDTRFKAGEGGLVAGTTVLFTSNVYTTSGVNYNVVMSSRCLVHVSKWDLDVELTYLPEYKVKLCSADYMDETAILNDSFGCPYKTAAAW